MLRRLKAYLQSQAPGGSGAAGTDEVVVQPAAHAGRGDSTATGPTSRPSQPFINGANCYYLLTRSASEETRHQVIAVLDGAVRMGYSMLRTWGFNDGDGWNALQTAPGVYDERVFAGLDWLLHQCQIRGLQLMLTLVNHWDDFGGAKVYVRWAHGVAPSNGGDRCDCIKAEEFYSNPVCIQMYQKFVRDMLTRVNTITGIMYREDPTIYAWDLINEPRNDSDPSGDIIQCWIDTNAAFIKSLAPTQLVTVGLEGFFGPSTPALMKHNPYGSSHGCDFERNISSPHLDFASIHLWVDQWCGDDSDAQKCAWAAGWIRSHAKAAQQLPGGAKPLVLQEYGKRPAGEVRKEFFCKVEAACGECERKGRALAGAFVWHLADASYPDYDGYTIYCEDPVSEAVGVQ